MKVVIAGAGPAGILLANYLIRRPGYEIQVVDRCPDSRGASLDALKSYPIAMQARGLEALRGIPGLERSIESQGIRPKSACFHMGKRVQKISMDPPKLFVDHGIMTATMLDNLMNTEKAEGSSLSVEFGCTVNDLDLDTKSISVLQDTQVKTLSFDHLVAADGGRSKVRQLLDQKGELQSEQKDIPDMYRTIYLSPTSPDGSIQLDCDSLHGWVMDKGKVRVLGAPIQKDSLSGAFVFDKQNNPIGEMKSPQDVIKYFEELSPESLAKLISLEEAENFLKRPASSLVTVRCDRLHVQDKVLLLGDAAHAMSQAVGHGCISALQDAQVFCHLLEKYDDDWRQALPAYTRERLEDAHALNEMSDYAAPSTKLMKVEWGLRQLSRKILPSRLGRFMRPLPVELLSDTTLSYREVLEQTRWWIDRVKQNAIPDASQE